MKTIISLFMIILSTGASAQKQNLDKLSEKERNEYLVKTAYDAVMKHAPEWYRDYKSPEITSFILNLGADKGRLQYSVTWFYDPLKEKMAEKYAVGVGIYADTGEVRAMGFGDGLSYIFSLNPTRNSESTFYYPYPKK